MVAPSSFTTERIDGLGAELYASWRTPEVEARERGRYIVFDIVSRDCEIADSDLDATDRIALRRPDGIFWGTRIGFDAAYHVRAAGNGQ